MKRDEALLKKAISEASRLKKQMQNMKPIEKLLVQPVAMPGAKARGKEAGD